MVLRKKLIRLAYTRHDLRPHLLPLLKKGQLAKNLFQVYQIGGRSSVVLTMQLGTPTPWYKKLGVYVSQLTKDAQSLVTFLKKTNVADGAKIIEQNDALLMPATKGLYLRVFVEVPDIDSTQLGSLTSQWGRIAGYAPQKKRF